MVNLDIDLDEIEHAEDQEGWMDDEDEDDEVQGLVNDERGIQAAQQQFFGDDQLPMPIQQSQQIPKEPPTVSENLIGVEIAEEQPGLLATADFASGLNFDDQQIEKIDEKPD